MSLKLIKQILDGEGNEQLLSGSVIIDPKSGSTFSQHAADASIHLKQSAIDTAISLLKFGADAADDAALPEEYNTVEKITRGLAGLKETITSFISGEADGGDIDKLVELVSAINANKSAIEAVVTTAIPDIIVDDLATNDATKILSAAQGKALKDLIDALSSTVVELSTRTGVAFIGAAGEDPVFDGKLVLLVAPYQPESPEETATE